MDQCCDRILPSIKKMLGMDKDYNAFDMDVIIALNSALTIVYQLGVGPQDRPYVIRTGDETWSDFFNDSDSIELVKGYLYLRARLLFDPPSTGVLHEAMERQIKEYEWRLNVQAETPAYLGEEGGAIDEGVDDEDGFEECSCGCGRLY